MISEVEGVPFEKKITEKQAVLWFLGQAGYYMESCGKRVLIDPYLSDSVAKSDARFQRVYPVPVDINEIQADLFLVTHDHLDHLDPETIFSYNHKDSTTFVAPRYAAKKLRAMGIKKVITVDHGDEAEIDGVVVKGVFALATSPDVLDTTGYLIRFPNGRTVYHSSDTAYCQLLLDACPQAEVLLVCINGKCGNLNIEEAIRLTKAVNPQFAVPNHYDVMRLNSEDPEAFLYFCEEAGIAEKCHILKPMDFLLW